MRPSKKNGILNFLFSFCPGAAEMYMGFMKNGVSLLALFVISFIIPAAMYGGDLFFVIPFVIYVYGFFHARNMAKASEENFVRIQDRYIWEEFIGSESVNIPEKTVRKWAAIILIVFGVCAIWAVVSDSLREILAVYLNDAEYQMFIEIFDTIPQIVIAILAIVIGVKMISGKKAEMTVVDSPVDLTAKIIAEAEEEIAKTERKEGEENGTESDK